jgi:hypothetical protein
LTHESWLGTLVSVAALRRFRDESSPLVLVGVWFLLSLAAIAVTATAPGSPFYSGDGSGSLGGAVFVTAFLGAFIFFGVRLAWWLTIIWDSMAVVLSLALFVSDPHPKPLVVGILIAAALWLIWSGSVEDYMHGDRRPAAARLH